MLAKVKSKNRLYFVGAAAVIVIIMGTIYSVAQQDLRQGANDPQIQTAEDSARKLNNGETPSILLGDDKVPVGSSLATFVIIYDKHGDVLGSSADLDGSTPELPAGVLAGTTATHEDQVTWEPEQGVRIAAVVVPFNGGYVLSGRSLREVEKREHQLGDLVGLGLVASLLILGGIYMALNAKKTA